MTHDPYAGWTTVGEVRRRQGAGGGGAPSVNPNAALFKNRDISGIFALAKRDVASARKAAQDAARGNPDLDRGTLEPIEYGACVGMVRGGKFGAIGGFGWESEYTLYKAS